MNLKALSYLISRIFDFYFWAPVILLMTIFNVGLSGQQIRILLPLLVIIDIIVPIGIFFLLLKKGQISDIDITKREERPKLFAGLTLFLVPSTILVFFFGNHLAFVIHLAGFLAAITILIITLFFKISGHLFINTLAIFLINYLLGWQLILLFIIVPIVAFARVYQKKHTLAEVLAGFVVGIVEPYLVLKIFG